MTTMPAQRPGKSKQDYATPPEFIAAVKAHLNIDAFGVDLAADADNAKAALYFDEEHDSLAQDWTVFAWRGWCWLNPPFADITPWAKKCAEAAREGVRIAFLVPAAVGANWFRDHVDGWAHVLFLNGRISFDGVGPYPKDCILCLYGPMHQGYEVWDWRKQTPSIPSYASRIEHWESNGDPSSLAHAIAFWEVGKGETQAMTDQDRLELERVTGNRLHPSERLEVAP